MPCDGASCEKLCTGSGWLYKHPFMTLRWCEVTVSKWVSWCFTPSRPVQLYQGEWSCRCGCLFVFGCRVQSLAPPMHWDWASCGKVMHWFQLITWASFLDPAVVWSRRCSCVFCVVAEEEASRFLTFCTNMKRIKTIQESEQGSATYGVNKFADISGTTPPPPLRASLSFFWNFLPLNAESIYGNLIWTGFLLLAKF